jgi:Lon protease-like protein
MSDPEIIYVPSRVPVFPLPQVVLFPGALLPLYVFEPRYREMTSDVIAGSGVLAIALLKPGFEPLYETRRAPIHSTIGLGQVVGSKKVQGENYRILLRGIGRARIVEESDERIYRLAQIEPLDTYCSSGADQADDLRSTLYKVINGNVALDDELRRHWLKLLEVSDDINELTDLLSATLPADAELRQRLLNEPDAAQRAEILVAQIQLFTAVIENRRRADSTGDHRLN